MKAKIISDLHLEGCDYNYRHDGEEVLFLTGDIHTKCRHHEFLSKIPSDVKIVMIAGNHEYYHGSFEEVNLYLSRLHLDFPNFTFLNNNSMVIDDLHIFGGTMFTDFMLHGRNDAIFAMRDAARGIADFHHIRTIQNDVERGWKIDDHIRQHEIYVRELKAWLKQTEGKKRVVLSHFIPSPEGIDKRFEGSSLNPYFTADMTQYMGWEGHWIFGHTHTSFDFMAGETRCIANPRGYGTENRYGFKFDLVIDI